MTSRLAFPPGGGSGGSGQLLPLYTGGRLSLNPGNAYGDNTNASTLYFTSILNDGAENTGAPFDIVLWNGTALQYHTSSEISLNLILTANVTYDVFIYNDAGTLKLELTPWQANDFRGDFAIQSNFGMMTKFGVPTKRWIGSIAASGTNRSSSNNNTRYLSNAYNQTDLVFKTSQSTSLTWPLTIGGASVSREMGGGLGLGNSYVQILACVDATLVRASALIQVYNPTALQDYMVIMSIGVVDATPASALRGQTAGSTPSTAYSYFEAAIGYSTTKLVVGEYWAQGVAAAGSAYWGFWSPRSWQMSGSIRG